MQNQLIKIYALINPISNQLFYVGATRQELSQRLQSHISCRYEDGKNIRHKIIRRIIRYNKKPEIIELDLVEVNEASFWEDFYLQYFRSYGLPLNQIKSTYTQRCVTQSLKRTKN